MTDHVFIARQILAFIIARIRIVHTTQRMKRRKNKWIETATNVYIRHEKVDAAERKGREEAIEELKSKKDEIIRWLIKRDKEGYGTTNGELLDHIFELSEQLKEQRINENNIADNTGSDT